ncbi:MAG: hypothetical protein E7464_02940 [Ruminococcaceae bacterium]|nr:hypothetical protein [Oscillospiraceae bacterium]
MTKKRICAVLNAAMILGVVLFLLLGLARAILRPKAVNDYENRTANQLPVFTLSGWLDGSFQQGVEDALGDQAPFSVTMKKYYNDMDNSIKYKAFTMVSEADPAQMVIYEGFRIYGGDHIAFAPQTWEEVEQPLQTRAQELSSVISAHPETDFHLYYIEHETDVVFETGEKLGIYEYLQENLPLSTDKMGCFEVNDLSDFHSRFYRTDHHWNWEGSYLGYQEAAKLLGVEPLVPTGEPVLMSSSFSGSKVQLLGSDNLFVEPFYAYPFSTPDMTVTVNGEPGTYGLQKEFFAGTASYLTYGSFYGGDFGEVIFDNGEGENLLILGESYDNAIVQLLASHFGRTHSVDLRHYETAMGQPFHLARYIEENDIDRVLLIGSNGFFTNEAFALED